jgi:proteasome lid subunit RPN8/RPN11
LRGRGGDEADVLILEARGLGRVKRHGEEGYPHEVCGLLVGSYEDGRSIRNVREVHPAGNLNRERAADRYDLDPLDYIRIEREAQARRLEVVGVYHSHPDHPSRPSETDRQRAEEIWQNSESWSYLILEVAAGRAASWRSWVLRDGVFHEEPSRIAGT